MVRLPATALEDAVGFSLYNSPYVAHHSGCAIDLYPSTASVRSPVAGEVCAIHEVAAPSRGYADDADYLMVIDTGNGPGPAIETADGRPALARVLHVDPAVCVGTPVAVGDYLGELLRSGYFARWVRNHLHLGFRHRDRDIYRASGSAPITISTGIEPLYWDGRGTITEVEASYARVRPHGLDDLDDGQWVALASEEGALLDGGLAHYGHGGILAVDGARKFSLTAGSPEVSLLETPVGRASGRSIAWHDVEIVANDSPVTGLALYCARMSEFAIKLVEPSASLSAGDTVHVRIASSKPVD